MSCPKASVPTLENEVRAAREEQSVVTPPEKIRRTHTPDASHEKTSAPAYRRRVVRKIVRVGVKERPEASPSVKPGMATEPEVNRSANKDSEPAESARPPSPPTNNTEPNGLEGQPESSSGAMAHTEKHTAAKSAAAPRKREIPTKAETATPARGFAVKEPPSVRRDNDIGQAKTENLKRRNTEDTIPMLSPREGTTHPANPAPEEGSTNENEGEDQDVQEEHEPNESDDDESHDESYAPSFAPTEDNQPFSKDDPPGDGGSNPPNAPAKKRRRREKTAQEKANHARFMRFSRQMST